MQWLLLMVADLLEVGWAVAMKYADGFTVLVPSVITGIGYILSAVFLALALKSLPLGQAYAMWTGFGILGTTLLGIILFGEEVDAKKILFLAMILGGIIGLRLCEG